MASLTAFACCREGGRLGEMQVLKTIVSFLFQTRTFSPILLCAKTQACGQHRLNPEGSGSPGPRTIPASQGQNPSSLRPPADRQEGRREDPFLWPTRTGVGAVAHPAASWLNHKC